MSVALCRSLWDRCFEMVTGGWLLFVILYFLLSISHFALFGLLSVGRVTVSHYGFVVDWSLWVGRFGLIAVGWTLGVGRCGWIAVAWSLRLGCFGLVAVGWSLWFGRCGLVAVGLSLWVWRCGLVAVGCSLWLGRCWTKWDDCYVGWMLCVGRCGPTAISMVYCRSVLWVL